jgi:hypothetical protein
VDPYSALVKNNARRPYRRRGRRAGPNLTTPAPRACSCSPPFFLTSLLGGILVERNGKFDLVVSSFLTC